MRFRIQNRLETINEEWETSQQLDLRWLYIYSMHDSNRLMSAMSIDGIWQNNLITLFLRLDRMQLASLAYVSVSMLANCSFPTKVPNSRHYIIPCMHVHWYLGT